MMRIDLATANSIEIKLKIIEMIDQMISIDRKFIGDIDHNNGTHEMIQEKKRCVRNLYKAKELIEHS